MDEERKIEIYTKPKKDYRVLIIIVLALVAIGLGYVTYKKVFYHEKEILIPPKPNIEEPDKPLENKKISYDIGEPFNFNSDSNLCKQRGYYLNSLDSINSEIYTYELTVCMGEQKTGGYSLNVENIDVDENEKVIITVKESYPDPKQTVTDALTYPAITISLSAAPKELVVKNVSQYRYKELEYETDYLSQDMDDAQALFNKINKVMDNCGFSCRYLPNKDKEFNYSKLGDFAIADTILKNMDSSKLVYKNNEKEVYAKAKDIKDTYLSVFGPNEDITFLVPKDTKDNDLVLLEDFSKSPLNQTCGRPYYNQKYNILRTFYDPNTQSVILDIEGLKVPFDGLTSINSSDSSYWWVTFKYDESNENNEGDTGLYWYSSNRYTETNYPKLDNYFAW